MSDIPRHGENPGGLEARYNLTKASGEAVDPLATYFEREDVS